MHAPRPRVRPAPAGALAYLAERTQLGVKFGLRTMRALVRILGHPERSSPALLVAGTNGKGSVAAYLDAALTAAGLRVGRYVSPHLVRVHERIALGGEEISPADLEVALGRVREAAEALVKAGRIPGHPTYFEALTAAAFVHFHRRRARVQVLEVGMGGRLDATNVSDPLVSAIVTVERDHEAFLGRSLRAIAREKAGVLRRGRTTVLGRLAPEAREAVGRRARAVGARLVDAWEGARVHETAAGTLEIRTPHGRYRGLVPLPGHPQRDNLLVALRVLEEVHAAGLAFDRATAARGLSAARWPGRFQLVPGRPRLLLDGAHNPAAAQSLAAGLGGIGPFVLLFGAMADKDVETMASILFPLARAVVLTQPRGGRAATPAALALRTGGLAREVHRERRVARALALARRLAGPRGTVVVAGSLYLVGQVLAELPG